LKKKKILEKKMHLLVYLIIGTVWILTVVYGSMDLYSYDMKYGMFSVIGSLFGSFLLIKAFLHINLIEWSQLDAVRWIGRYSMWFLYFHAIENAVFPWKILFKFVEQGSALATVLHFVIRFILIAVGCYVVQFINVRRSKKREE